MTPLFLLVSSVGLIALVYLYWRFFFFFRDPNRAIPPGKNIVSPADGTVVYIKKIEGAVLPISVKSKKEIRLEEILKYTPEPLESSYLIGIFMHPTSVHVNRAPISGTVQKVIYTPSKNEPMTAMWWRVLFGIKPYESYSSHIFRNERNTILIKGEIPVSVVQIADIYVNKIECWKKEGSTVEKGERFGMIKMGSQVDLFFPASRIANIVIREGQKVLAGESIIATLV